MKSPILLDPPIEWENMKRGKIRFIYDVGDALIFVTSDGISAFDIVMKNGIPDKGKILNQMSEFWFNKIEDELGIPNHMITTNAAEYPKPFCDCADILQGRSMMVRKLEVIPIECIVRGYITGSGWKEYLKSGTVCGIPLPPGLKQCDKLPEPKFTPSTKADQGLHDENISPESARELLQTLSQELGINVYEIISSFSLKIYSWAAEYLAKRGGVILADTKFEFGFDRQTNKIYLIDEVLTPDSSRFWPAAQYEPGRDQESFDKQAFRNYLERIDFDKDGNEGIIFPQEVVTDTRSRYLEAFEKVTGKKFE